MIDDQDEALLSAFETIQETEIKFQTHGQLFHFSRSGSGTSPPCRTWPQEERPPQVLSVGNWKEVLQHLNVPQPTAAVPVIKPGIHKRPREQPPIHPDVENDPDWQHLCRERQNATRAKNTEEEIATWSRHKTNRHTSDDEQDTPWERWTKGIEFKAPAPDLQIPAMPLLAVKADSQTHRFKLEPSWCPFPVAVTKMMSKKEMREIPEALEAMRKEFARLSGKCWIEKDRRSKREVIAEARKTREVIHFSMVHGIIGEKGAELPKGDPRRKYKGRAVVLGDRVFDQDYETATFADLGSAPTTLEGGRVVDAYGCAPGNDSQTSDAIQAFCQAPMLSKVWVTLPAEAIFDPDFYWQVNDPVVLLILALYGYPDSPTFWENHCDNQVLMTGWSKLGPE